MRFGQTEYEAFSPLDTQPEAFDQKSADDEVAEGVRVVYKSPARRARRPMTCRRRPRTVYSLAYRPPITRDGSCGRSRHVAAPRSCRANIYFAH